MVSLVASKAYFPVVGTVGSASSFSLTLVALVFLLVLLPHSQEKQPMGVKDISGVDEKEGPCQRGIYPRMTSGA